jgi:serine/threonine protein kinase
MRCHNVCKVYGTAEKEGKLCIVMKLYKESMRGLLGRSEGGKLGLDAVKRYGGDICKAIAELHEQNIILQDLKPPNILLDEYDHCVLADFGISKFVQGSNPHMPSHVQGTFNYMSPEAFDPEHFGGITVRTDSWSFACTLLEMLTGDQPWKDMKMAPICFKVMQRQIPDIPAGLPQVLRSMLEQCFAFEPEKRPSFKEMYSVFRTEWTSAKDHIQRTDPLGIGPILDVFRGGSDGSSSPVPRGSFAGGNKFKVTALPVPPAAGASGRTSSASDALQWGAPGIDGDSSIAGLYKRAAEADEAKRIADSAKREVEDMKTQMVLFREANDSAEMQAKDAVASKEEVVGNIRVPIPYPSLYPSRRKGGVNPYNNLSALSHCAAGAASNNDD